MRATHVVPLVDVMTLAEDGLGVWQNQGKGQFQNCFGASPVHLVGELTYMSESGAIAGNTCDINNDGRQDIFLVYPAAAPTLFFSRGFRCFGFAHKPVGLSEFNPGEAGCFDAAFGSAWAS